jgi:NADH-quinone oxidoreductase subunit G
VAKADLAIAVASFAESDGIFINLEGRVQAFHKAILSETNAPPAWQVLRDAAIKAGRVDAAEWQSHASLLDTIAADIPELAACRAAWPIEEGSRPATLPHRHSGRTAANAHVDVREAMPLRHEDSPFAATMESETTAMPWEPGWNSVQVTQRISEPHAPDIFLFEDRETEDVAVPEVTPPDDRLLGIEELSQLSPAIIAYQKAISP